MSKQELIHAIQRSNPTADTAMLMVFSERALTSYLRRLQTLVGRRGPGTRWVRENDTPAIVSRITPRPMSPALPQVRAPAA